MSYYIRYINSSGKAETHPIGLSLTLMRKQRKLTQEQASRLVGLNRRTLSCYENATHDIPITVFIRLIHLYGFKITHAYEAR